MSERRQGNSRLVYNKTTRTIDTIRTGAPDKMREALGSARVQLLAAQRACRRDKSELCGVPLSKAEIDALIDALTTPPDRGEGERMREAIAFLTECYALLITIAPDSDWSRLEAFLGRAASCVRLVRTCERRAMTHPCEPQADRAAPKARSHPLLPS